MFQCPKSFCPWTAWWHPYYVKPCYCLTSRYFGCEHYLTQLSISVIPYLWDQVRWYLLILRIAGIKRITVQLKTAFICLQWALWLNVIWDQKKNFIGEFVCIFKTHKTWTALVAVLSSAFMAENGSWGLRGHSGAELCRCPVFLFPENMLITKK